MNLFDAIKYGIGFYIGYKIATKVDEILGERYVTLKKEAK